MPIICFYFARLVFESRLCLLALVLLTPGAQAVEVSQGFPLAIRTGEVSCWVKGKVEGGVICVPREIWTRDFEMEGNWEGRWSASSPPDNDGGPKRIFRTFHAQRKTSEDISHPFFTFIEQKREVTSQIIADHFSDPYGIFKRLILNESGPTDASAFFRLLGFVHLFSASGIHLYALSAWVGWCLSLIGSYLLVPISIGLFIARFFSISLWLWGWALTGCKLSLLRPLLLISIRRLASILGFRWRPWTPLVLAIVADILFSSFVFQSDWLQGAAFYALAIAGGALADGHILVCLSSWIFLGIWEAIKSAHIALFTPIFSLLTLAVTTGVIYPILIFSSLSHYFPFSGEISGGFNSFIQILLKMSFLTGNLWIARPGTVIVSIFIVSFCSLFKKSFRYSFLVLSAVTIALFRWIPHQSSITQIDVGQGDGALYSGETTGMVDSGSKRALGDVAWIELFAREGISQISWIGITHLDEDHSGGALRLARLVPIGCLATSDNELISPRGVVYEEQLKSMGVEVDHSLSTCVPFPSYEPAPTLPTEHVANENMSAFLIPFRQGFWLSAGDATQKDELKIGAWARGEIEKLNLDSNSFRILKVSHHGSKTSSNPAFIEMIHPTEAWISDGVGNHYGHPAPSILDEFLHFGIPVRRTDESGEIKMTAAIREGDDRRRQ